MIVVDWSTQRRYRGPDQTRLLDYGILQLVIGCTRVVFGMTSGFACVCGVCSVCVCVVCSV